MSQLWASILSAAPAAPEQQTKRCPNCDDTGDVNSIDGEWRGTCHCPTGQASNAQQAEAQEPQRWHVGDSGFEGWYSDYLATAPVHQENKQRLRDAYAAGMGERPQPARLQALSEEEAITAWRGVKDVGDDKYNAILLSEAVQSALAAKNGVNLK